MARKRIIRETPLDDGKQPAIDLPTGGKMEFPEPAKLIEESVELDAAETVLLDQLVKDKLQEAQQVQQAQASSSGDLQIVVDDTIDPPAIAAEHSTAEKAESLQAAVDEQGQQFAAAAHDATAAIDAFLKEPAIAEAVAQQEELQRLMQLPLSQIEELPQAKRELVWQELARQIVETPGFVDAMTAITAASKKAMEAAARLAEWATTPAEESPLFKFAQWATQPAGELERSLQQMAENAGRSIKGAGAALESIRKGIANLLSDDTREALQTWAILAPYIEAEADENPELYDNPETPATVLIAAAARRARADGKEIPPLKAEEEPEQMQMQLDLPADTDKEENRRKHIAEAHKRREKAQQKGALIATEANLAIIADKDLGFAYFTREVLKKLPREISELTINQQTGQINLYDLTGTDKTLEEVLQEVDLLHTGFLMLLFGLAWNNSDIRETNSGNAIIPIYLPAVLDRMGIDPRTRTRDKETKQLTKRDTNQTMAQARFEKFMEFMRPLDKVAAWFGDDLYPVARFAGYEADSETYSINAPYMFKLVEYAKLHATRHGAISNVFHADIMTENQTAVEIANRIAMGLIIRGVTRPDNETYQNAAARKPIKKKTTRTAADGTKTVEELTFAPEPEPTVTKSRTDENGITTTVTGTKKKPRTFTYKVKFSTLIEDCPELQRELEAIRNGQGAAEKAARDGKKKAEEIAAARRSDHKNDSQRINKKLKDTFTAAIRIIMEKSEIPKYYKGLTIKTAHFDTFKAPTNSMLNEQLIITHSGKDPTFSE